MKIKTKGATKIQITNDKILIWNVTERGNDVCFTLEMAKLPEKVKTLINDFSTQLISFIADEEI